MTLVPLFPVPLRPGRVIPARAPSIGQINLFKKYCIQPGLVKKKKINDTKM